MSTRMANKPGKPKMPERRECKAADKQFCAFELSNRPANIGGRKHNRWDCTNEGCVRTVYN